VPARNPADKYCFGKMELIFKRADIKSPPFFVLN